MSNFLRFVGGVAKGAQKRIDERREEEKLERSIKNKAYWDNYYDNYFDGSASSTFTIGGNNPGTTVSPTSAQSSNVIRFNPVMGTGITAQNSYDLSKNNFIMLAEVAKKDPKALADFYNSEEGRLAINRYVTNSIVQAKSEYDVQKYEAGRVPGFQDIDRLVKGINDPTINAILADMKKSAGQDTFIENPTMKQTYGDDWNEGDGKGGYFEESAGFSEELTGYDPKEKASLEQSIVNFFRGEDNPVNRLALGRAAFTSDYGLQNKGLVYDALNRQMRTKNEEGSTVLLPRKSKEEKKEELATEARDAHDKAFRLLNEIGIRMFGSSQFDSKGNRIEGTYTRGELVTGKAFALRRTLAGVFGKTGQFSQLRAEIKSFGNKYGSTLKETNAFLKEATGMDINQHLQSLDAISQMDLELTEDGLYRVSEGQRIELAAEDQTAALESLQIALAFTIAIANQNYEGGKAVSDADFQRAYEQVTGERRKGGLFSEGTSLEQIANIHAVLYDDMAAKAFDADIFLGTAPGYEEKAITTMNGAVNQLAATQKFNFYDRMSNTANSYKLRWVFGDSFEKIDGNYVKPDYTRGLQELKGQSTEDDIGTGLYGMTDRRGFLENIRVRDAGQSAYEKYIDAVQGDN